MKQYRIWGLIAGIVIATPALAGITVDTSIDTDSKFAALNVNELWVAEGRAGTAGSSGDWEAGIGLIGSHPDDEAQLMWPNGGDVAFSLKEDAGEMVFNLGGAEAKIATPANLGDALYIRAVAHGKNGGTATLSLSDLVFNGMSLPTLNGDADGNYLALFDLTGGSFELTGTANFAWTGDFPSRSRTAFQIKAAQTVIPAPGAALLALLGTSAIAALRRRIA